MRKGNKFLALMLAGILTAGALTGCSAGNEKKENQATPTVDATQSQTGNDTQSINFRVTALGSNYDVQDMGWRWMMADCYEGLYRNVASEKGEELILAGAEKVDISEDQLTYTFHLRKDAKWSDGVAVTAKDYEYGWKRLLNPEYGYSYAYFLFNVVGAQEYYHGEGSVDDVMAVAKDDYTFEVTLKVPDPTFTAKLVATPLYPTRQDVAEAAGDQWGKDWKLCVYNGPFVMSELVEENKMVWAKNDQYWDAANVKLETVNWFVVGQDSTASTMFDNNELDVIQTSGDYLIKYSDQVAKGEISEVTTDYPGTRMLCFNLTGNSQSGLMDNAKIRQAISYCLNKEDMISAIYGRYKAAYGLVAPAISFNNESYRSQSEEPGKADYEANQGNKELIQKLFKEGLEELGVTTPVEEITLTLLGYGSAMQDQNEREYIQQVISQNIGCKVEQNVVGDYTLYKAERDANHYDIVATAWYSDYNDPLDFLNIFAADEMADSYGGYNDPEYDKIIDSLVGVSDMEKRLEIYEQAEAKLANDYVFVPIFYSTKQLFLKNWVKELKTSSFGASQELYRCYIEGRNK